MADTIIRCANNADNLFKIASCIYLTDPFIYPAAFGTDIQIAASAISKLMGVADGLFNPKNIVVALHEGKICGILLHNKNHIVWNHEECADLVQGIVPSLTNFRYVSDAYFSVEAAPHPEKHFEIIACSVMPEFRNMGVGKRMLDWLIREYPQNTIELDVLADNAAAIHLYKKCGFEIQKELKGFSMTEETRPDCYHMFRKC